MQLDALANTQDYEVDRANVPNSAIIPIDRNAQLAAGQNLVSYITKLGCN
ncbi:hypothetical protein VCRA2123E76_170001 [Vibrio crassostreae]|nr:hypothetical protein VCRA2123E76_170001 [Vibrio crassostreae]